MSYPQPSQPITPANHPTGIVVVLASAAVVIAKWCGVEISAEEAAVVIGALGAVASLFNPRFARS